MDDCRSFSLVRVNTSGVSNLSRNIYQRIIAFATSKVEHNHAARETRTAAELTVRHALAIKQPKCETSDCTIY